MRHVPDSMYSTESTGKQLPCSGCMSSFPSHCGSRLLKLSSSLSGSNFFNLKQSREFLHQQNSNEPRVHEPHVFQVTHLEGRYLNSSSWKSIFSSFLHFVFRTRAERLFAVSPLSSTARFLFGAFLTLSVSDTSIAVTVNTQEKNKTVIQLLKTENIHHRLRAELTNRRRRRGDLHRGLAGCNWRLHAGLGQSCRLR